MKKSGSLFLFMFVSVFLFSQNLDDGLIYYFPFSDSIAEQQSGTPLQMVGPDSLSENRFGASNCAWDLSENENTISYYLNEPDFSSPVEKFTVALWMQLDAADSAEIADYQKLVTMNDFHFGLFDLNTPLVGCGNCGLWDMEWNENYFTEDDYNNTYTWYQLVWSFDQGEMKLYRDGELKNSSILQDVNNVSLNEVILGDGFFGKLDDIRIYNRVLSESEIADLFELEEGCAEVNCEIGSPELSNFECLGDSAYIVTLDFDYVNTSDSFDLETRTDDVGRYGYADLPLRLTLPFSGLSDELLSITDAEMTDCEFEFEFEVDCGGAGNCEIGSPELSNFECLGDSAYIVTLDFDYVNTSDSFDLETRTDDVGRYGYADLPLRLTLPFSGLSDELLSITDAEMTDCEFEFEFEVDCGGAGNCEIGSPELSNFECLGDSAYIVTLDFDYVNTSDSFDLETRTEDVGRYAYSDLPLRLTLPFSGLPDELLSITDVEMPDCEFEFEFEVDCGTTSISDFEKMDIRVYPNPFQQQIKVSFSQGFTVSYEILSACGGKVLEGKIRSGEQIRTGRLSPGYFLFHIRGNSYNEWIPFIKAQ